MGSFVQKLSQFDPIQRFAGPHSFIAKEDSFDPIMKNTANGQAYANRMNVGPQAASPFAGVAPTLQDANNGYLQASRQAMQQRPVMQSPYQQGS